MTQYLLPLPTNYIGTFVFAWLLIARLGELQFLQATEFQRKTLHLDTAGASTQIFTFTYFLIKA